MVKNPHAMQEPQETLVRSLGRGDPLERAWQPTLVFLPGELHGERSLAGSVHGLTKSWTQPKQLGMHTHTDIENKLTVTKGMGRDKLGVWE